MAIDRLKQVGKSLNKTSSDIGHTNRKVSRNLVVREGNNDLIGSLYTYTLEFKSYGSEAVTLELKFLDKFDEKIGEPWILTTR